jgi:ankyrin repeat protein
MQRKRKTIPLIEAVLENNLELVEKIIIQGGNVDEQDAEGFSALHYTAQNYLVDIAKLLIEKKANIECRDSYGNTPLQKAVFFSNGRGDMIKLLLKHGANKDSENNSGISPWELANTIANYDNVKFFKK